MSRKMIDYKVENGKITSIDGYEVGGGTAVEANPQEEATQQLDKIKIDNIAYNIAGGGSGNYNIEVQRIRSDSITDGSYSNSWNLQANTAYEVGDIVKYYKSKRCSQKQLKSNEMLVPIKLRASAADDKKTLKFGDVILILTNVEIKGSFAASSNNQYQLFTDTTYTYTVIKAGTTGSDVTLNSSGFDEVCQCMVCTLGVTKAAQ